MHHIDDTTSEVMQRLGDATEEDAEAVIALAMLLWREQIDGGLGYTGEQVSREAVLDWLHNRTYEWVDLYAAASGDVGALVRVRQEAGLPVL